MITTKGKNIIAKYLIGQAPAYASYMAFGCGPKPLEKISHIVTKKKIDTALATITTSAAHNFQVDMWVIIDNVDTTFNGRHKIKAVPTSNTFTFDLTAGDVVETILSPTGTVFIDYSEKQSLDFEMFRVPIISRGYVNESGVNKIVFTSELPTEERYEISEIGIYSAGSNPSAVSNDSRTVLSFTTNENWEYHTASQAVGLKQYVEPLHSDAANTISITDKVFTANANNQTFTYAGRVDRYEVPRFLNSTVISYGTLSNLGNTVSITNAVGSGSAITYTTALPHTLSVGDQVSITGVTPTAYNIANAIVTEVTSKTVFKIASTITGTYTSGGSVDATHLVINNNSEHIHLAGVTLNLNKNAPSDELRLAFSVLNKIGSDTDVFSSVKIIVEFANVDTTDAEFARLQVDLTNGTSAGQYDFSTNRYVVVKKQLQELYKTSGFNWGDVNIIKIYASVIADGAPSNDYLIAFDAVRLENLNTINPLYGLTGYSVISNTDSSTITKEPNTVNLSEFRFAMDVA